MEQVNIALFVVGTLVLVLGLFSGLTRMNSIPDPLVSLVVGILLGPRVFDVLDTGGVGEGSIVVEEAARLTLAVGLMAVALRIPQQWLTANRRPVAVLIGLVMPAMWLVSGLLVFVVLGVPFWVAMLAGGVLTPTDPVVASTIVTGRTAEKNLPESLRHTLSAESGLNDGLAYPLVILPILMLHHASTGAALREWVLHTIIWEVIVAVMLGAIAGYVTGQLLEWAEKRELIREPSLFAYTIALSLAVLGGAKLLGTDGILAVFVAGVALNVVVGNDRRVQVGGVQEAVNRFFILPVFVLLGIALPWDAWFDLGWRGLLLSVLILFLRRLPAVLLFGGLMGRQRERRDRLFIGWFGPIGVAALYYATLSRRETGEDSIWAVASLMICVSLLAHGLSSGMLTRRYGATTPPGAEEGDAP